MVNLLGRMLALFAILAFVLPFWAAPASMSPAPIVPAWQARVDPAVLSGALEGETEFLVYLQEQADLSGADGLAAKSEKGTYVYQRLSQTARRTQAGIILELQAHGVPYQAFWVTNLLWVRGDLSILQSLAARPEVARIAANPAVQADIPDAAAALEMQLLRSPQGVEWNIQKVGAPQMWAAGYTGQGAVIGGQDTGYDWSHPAIKQQYRGWDGASADHNYAWHDAIHQDDPHTSLGNPCGFDSPLPCDDYGHGTHTMGTMLGDDGAGNQVGMAPGARWIGCRNMEQGWGKPSTYLECYQWFLAPTDLSGQNPRPDLAPDVINNSWACPSNEGCTDPFVLQQAVENLRAAGILSVHSAGNSGPSCGTVNTPAAIYDASFTVGATDSADQIAGFSSRGLSAYTGLLKPDISAPGDSIRSSVPGGGYNMLDGTSMAAPHVAGLAALLLSANPGLRGRVDVLEQVIERSAVPRTSTQTCGGVSGNQIPNPVFGWGRIDVAAAYASMRIDVTKIASSPSIEPGGVITYTLSVRNHDISQPVTNLVLTDTLPANTVFLSATQPYSLNGDVIQWVFAPIQPGGIAQVELAVSASAAMAGFITNSQYTALSDQVGNPVTGPPVVTRVGSYFLLLPLVYK